MYTVKLNDEVFAHTDWAPLAQAAWHRVATDGEGTKNGAVAQIWKDGVLLASERPNSKFGYPWPDQDVPPCDWNDVMKAIFFLLREDEWDAKEIAEAMSAAGLPTTRSRVDALRGTTQGRRANVIPPEVVVLLHAVPRTYRAAKNE